MNVTWLPLLVMRSVMPPVGSPPDQNSASMVPSFMPCTVSGSDSDCFLMSLSGFRPAAFSRRSAMFSVPELGEPVEIRLPFMSATVVMPVPVRAITWV